jgi:hypothetical protein
MGVFAAFVHTPAPGPKVLQFPVDPAVRARLKAARKETVNVPGGGDKVIFLRHYRRPKRR